MGKDWKKSASKWSQVLQVLGVLAALGAIVVSIVFGVRAERRTEIEIRYLANLSMINPEGVPEENVHIWYGDEQIVNLSKLSARGFETSAARQLRAVI